MNRILEQWQALTAYFAHSARVEKLIKAERLHGFLSNPHFKIFFIFLNFFILPKFTEFNMLFMKCILVIPHSNADTERVFSQVNLIKTELRNRLKINTVSALLSAKGGIKITSGDCCKFSPSGELVKLMQSAVLYDYDGESYNH